MGYIFNGQAEDIEDKRNKTQEITENSTADKYPSAKAVADYVNIKTTDFQGKIDEIDNKVNLVDDKADRTDDRVSVIASKQLSLLSKTEDVSIKTISNLSQFADLKRGLVICTIDTNSLSEYGIVNSEKYIAQSNTDKVFLLNNVGTMLSIDKTTLEVKKMQEQSAFYITPEMYGAKGDGVTDDTNAIQSAIDTGKPVMMSQSYKTTRAISINTDTKLFGGGVIVRTAKDCSGTSPQEDFVFTVNDGEVIIEDISFASSRLYMPYEYIRNGNTTDTFVSNIYSAYVGTNSTLYLRNCTANNVMGVENFGFAYIYNNDYKNCEMFYFGGRGSKAEIKNNKIAMLEDELLQYYHYLYINSGVLTAERNTVNVPALIDKLMQFGAPIADTIPEIKIIGDVCEGYYNKIINTTQCKLQADYCRYEMSSGSGSFGVLGKITDEHKSDYFYEDENCNITFNNCTIKGIGLASSRNDTSIRVNLNSCLIEGEKQLIPVLATLTNCIVKQTFNDYVMSNIKNVNMFDCVVNGYRLGQFGKASAETSGNSSASKLYSRNTTYNLDCNYAIYGVVDNLQLVNNAFYGIVQNKLYNGNLPSNCVNNLITRKTNPVDYIKLLEGKQDMLIAGTGIKIENNVISVNLEEIQ